MAVTAAVLAASDHIQVVTMRRPLVEAMSMAQARILRWKTTLIDRHIGTAMVWEAQVVDAGTGEGMTMIESINQLAW